MYHNTSPGGERSPDPSGSNFIYKVFLAETVRSVVLRSLCSVVCCSVCRSEQSERDCESVPALLCFACFLSLSERSRRKQSAALQAQAWCQQAQTCLWFVCDSERVSSCHAASAVLIARRCHHSEQTADLQRAVSHPGCLRARVSAQRWVEETRIFFFFFIGIFGAIRLS